MLPAYCTLTTTRVRKISVGESAASYPNKTTPMEIFPRLAHDMPAIGHALGHFSIVVEAASMCERGYKSVGCFVSVSSELNHMYVCMYVIVCTQ